MVRGWWNPSEACSVLGEGDLVGRVTEGELPLSARIAWRVPVVDDPVEVPSHTEGAGEPSMAVLRDGGEAVHTQRELESVLLPVVFVADCELVADGDFAVDADGDVYVVSFEALVADVEDEVPSWVRFDLRALRGERGARTASGDQDERKHQRQCKAQNGV